MQASDEVAVACVAAAAIAASLCACSSVDTGADGGNSVEFRLVSPGAAPDTDLMAFTPPTRQANRAVTEHLHVHRKPLLDGRAIKGASAGKRPHDSFPEVVITLTDEGARQFAGITRENVNRRLAIVVNGEVLLAPFIRMEVDGGAVVLGNIATEDEARQIAARINRARQ